MVSRREALIGAGMTLAAATPALLLRLVGVGALQGRAQGQ